MTSVAENGDGREAEECNVMSLRVVTLSIITAVGLLSTAPSRARASETADQIYRAIAGKCDFGVMDHVTMAGCMADAVKHMKIRLASEYRKQLASADGAEANGDMGGKTGAQIAREERADVIKAQRTWQAYSDAECAKVTDAIDLGGGNGSNVLGPECELRHMALRIIELQQ